MSIETYYTILDVPETATQAEIKAAYRELVRQVHPDSVPTATPYWKQMAEEKTKEVNEAYSVLADISKRREYDRLLAEARQETVSQNTEKYTVQSSPTPQAPAQTQGSSFYCSVCGNIPYASGYCPVCQRITRTTTKPPAKPRQYSVQKPKSAMGAISLVYLYIIGAGILFAILRMLLAALLLTTIFAGLLCWRKIFKIFPQYQRWCIAALVVCVAFVVADLASPSDDSNQSQAVRPELTKTSDPNTAATTLPLIKKSPPLNLNNILVTSQPSNGIFDVDPMIGYGKTKTFMGVNCSWDNVDTNSREKWISDGVIPDHTFLISPMDETCYIWNKDVNIFVAKGAVRAKPVFKNSRVIGYMRPVPLRTYIPKPESAISPLPTSREPASLSKQLSVSQPERQPEQLTVAPRTSDLSHLNYEEKQSMESACSAAKFVQGPAAYNRCLSQQLEQLTAAPKTPDLSHLSYEEKQSIESACSAAKFVQGPAAYNRCLMRQLQSLSGR